MKSYSAGGRQISYLDEGSGPVLVLLHAFPLGPEQWRPQIDHFKAGWRCIAPAAPGFGSTAFPSPSSLAQIGLDMEHLLAHLGLTEPVVLCGLSMGGYAAQWHAHQWPDRIRALVLCDTKAAPDDEAARAKRDDNIRFAASNSTAALMDRLRPALLGEYTLTSRPDVIRAVDAIALRHAPERLAEGTAALRDRPDMRPWLAAISVPTLLLSGDEDKLVSAADIATLQGIPGARLLTLHQSGHLSNLETPDAFNAALQNFLTDL